MRRVALALLLAAVWPYHLAAQTIPPELPRSVPSVAMPAVVRVLTVAGNLQAALDSAKSGDAVELPCGATYTGSFVLRSSGIVIRPTCWASLPPSGTRLTPARALALNLPKIVTPDYNPAVYTALGAHHYRLIGLDISVAPSVTATNYGLVLLGSGDVDQTTVASMAHDLVLDRVYVHGAPTVSLKRCVGLNSGTTVIVDSYLSECHADGQESQAIAGWNGSGPYLIENSYLEGAGINVLFGGADPSVPGVVPSDITIRRSHLTKPLGWQGSRWTVKNLLEIKHGQRILIDANVMENSWQHAQNGNIMVLWATGDPWGITRDLTIRRNVIRNVGSGFILAANAPGQHNQPLTRVAITQNLVTGLSALPGDARGFAIGGGASSILDVQITHNTVLGTRSVALLLTGPQTKQLTVTDNVLEGGTYGLIGDGTGIGSPTLAFYAPDAVFSGNVLTGGLRESRFPGGNNYPQTLAAVGLDSTFRLSAASPYRGTATDGRDPGADVPAVLAAVAGVVEGTPNSPAPVPVPVPVPSITLAQLRAAIIAIDKVVSTSGRENAATKAALAPVAVYLHALLGATP